MRLCTVESLSVATDSEDSMTSTRVLTPPRTRPETFGNESDVLTSLEAGDNVVLLEEFAKAQEEVLIAQNEIMELKQHISRLSKEMRAAVEGTT